MSRHFTKEQREQLLSLRTEIVDGCEICSGRGYLLKEDGSDEACQCMKVFVYAKELLLSDIPSMYWELSWKELDIPTVYKEFLKEYFQHFSSAVRGGYGIFFMGTNGIGKTSMMCEVGKQAIARGFTTVYFTVQKYIDAVIQNNLEEQQRFITSQVLLVDEIDKAYMKEGSSFVPKTLEQLFRQTIPYGRVVVAATNETPDGIRELLGESTVSMLMRRLKFVPVRGDDLSGGLQSSWRTHLKKQIDFTHSNIVEVAVQAWSSRNAS